MTIYTKAGDKGKTQIRGEKVSKNDVFVEAIGSLDEAQAHLGLLQVKTKLHRLEVLVDQMYTVMGLVALNIEESEDVRQWVTDLENDIDKNMANTQLSQFLRPVGSETIAQAHITRTVIRRAERDLVTAGAPEFVLTYINRLSDYVFSLIVVLTLS
jgi:cob(I)alamin adenosyltransferase